LSHDYNGLKAHQNKLGLLNSMHFLEKSEMTEDSDDKIFFQAWGSFFVVDSSQKIPVGSKFYENTEYKEQLKRGVKEESDQYGEINVPGEKSFWILQNKKGVYMLSSRRDAITKFKHFVPFSGLKDGASAMTELGNFDEGFCLQINSIGETCILCFSSSNVISKFSTTLKSMKGSSQTKA
jgi:hypothetical protein